MQGSAQDAVRVMYMTARLANKLGAFNFENHEVGRIFRSSTTDLSATASPRHTRHRNGTIVRQFIATCPVNYAKQLSHTLRYANEKRSGLLHQSWRVAYEDAPPERACVSTLY